MGDSSDEDSLGEFMEVVTMYRCKFCTFTTSGSREMAHHVKAVHVRKSHNTENTAQSTEVPQRSPGIVSLVKPASPNFMIQNNIARAITTDDSAAATYELVSSAGHMDYEQTGLNCSNISSQGSYSAMPVMNLSTQTSVAVSGGLIITMSNSTKQNQIEQNRPNDDAAVEEANADQQIGDYRFICQNSDGHYVLQNSENVQIGPNGTVHVLVHDSSIEPGRTTDALTGSAEEPYVVAGAVSESDTHVEGEANDDIGQQTFDTMEVGLGDDTERENQEDVITKELYLCGNCSEGFASIQACKDHMTNVHEVTDFQTSGRVDAGTQVEPRKKPGRKKKSEIVQAVKVEPEEITMSESDEDWAEQLMTYSTRSRRKRKPPQALKNDYYLGRTKKKEQNKREPKELNVRCDMKGCTARFKDEETMKKHLQCHIGADTIGPQFKCTACGEIYKNWKQTRHHMWKMHRIGIDLVDCPLCEYFKTDAQSKLKIHLETHGSERLYSCSVCGKTFKQFSQMKNHEICHLSGEVVNSKELSDRWHTPKTCDICGRKFVNVKCMRKHKEAVHAGIKDFKCTYCNYECSRKAMLVLHLRTHTGDKPFKCDLCAYCCGDHNSLRRHKMRHSGLKPYKCPNCPYASIQAISLKVHVKNKHPGMGGVYSCELCLYKTVNGQQFENHLMDHKNGLIKTEPGVKEVIIDFSKHFPQVKRPGNMVIDSDMTTVYTTVPGNQNILQVLQSQVVPGTSIQAIESPGSQAAVPAPALILNDGNVDGLQLRMNENGENVDVEDVATEGLASNDVAAAQLVYSALSAISQSAQNGTESIDSHRLVSGVENGEIQTSIETQLKEGVTTYTITFHLPEGEEISREVTLHDPMESKDGMNVVQNVGVNDWQDSGTVAELVQET